MIQSLSFAAVCCALLLLPACFTTTPSCIASWQKKQDSNTTAKKSLVIPINSAEAFETEVIKSKVPVMVKFFAKWCGSCKVMKPRVDEIAEELHPEYKVVSVDVDAQRALATKYLINGIPAFILFKDGKQINKEKKLIGVIEKDQLKNEFYKAFTT